MSHFAGRAPFVRLRAFGRSVWWSLLVAVLVLEVLSGTVSVAVSILLLVLATLFGARAIPTGWMRQFVTGPDFWVATGVLVTCASTMASTYRENSVVDGAAVIVGCLTYLLLRRATGEQIRVVSAAICFWAIFAGTSALVRFHSHYLEWRSLQFPQDASGYKRHLPLIPASGAPGTPNYLFVALLALVLPVFARSLGERRISFVVLSGTAVLVLAADVCCTFSRAAYLAIATLILVFVSGAALSREQHSRRVLLVLAGAVACSFSLTALTLRKPVFTTLAGVKTVSQKRSTEGRMTIGASILPVALSQASALGAGPGNFVLTFGKVLPDGRVVKQAFNAFLQLLTEYGVLGMFVWLALFLVTGLRLVRALRDGPASAQAGSALAGIAAIFVYNVFQSAFFAGSSLAATTLAVFALYGTEDQEAAAQEGALTRYFAWWVSLVCCTCWILPVWHSEATNKELQAACRYYFAGNIAEAIRKLQRLRSEDSHDVVVALVNLRLTFPDTAADFIEQRLAQRSQQTVAVSRNRVVESLKLCRELEKNQPDEDLAFHDAAWLEWMLGDLDGAVRSAARAVDEQPVDPVYRVTSGLMLEMSGRRDQARAEYATALALDPRIALSEFFRDAALRDAGWSRSILKDASERLEALADDPLAVAKLGALQVFEHQATGRENLYTSLAVLPSLGGAWAALAMSDCDGGDIWQAKADLSKARFLLRSNDTLYPFVAARLKGDCRRAKSAPDIRSRATYESPHALRTRVRYLTEYPLQDDLLPPFLSRYLAPACFD